MEIVRTRTMDEGVEFWNSFLRAVGTEPLPPRDTLQGASGLNHPVIALGSDENLHRLVIVSGDPDARTAALAQAAESSSAVFRSRASGMDGRTGRRRFGRSAAIPDPSCAAVVAAVGRDDDPPNTPRTPNSPQIIT